MKNGDKIIELLAEYLKKTDKALERLEKHSQQFDRQAQILEKQTLVLEKHTELLEKHSEEIVSLRKESLKHDIRNEALLKEIFSISKRVGNLEDKG
jgi:hypothetical protein